jgi:hypothetical protein
VNHISSCKDSKTPAKRVRAERRYGCCSKIRYNSLTYKVEIVDVDNSDASNNTVLLRRV